jgi:hypothetical protein
MISSFLLISGNPNLQVPYRNGYQRDIDEVKSFIYKTIYELYRETYKPEDGYVSERVLREFSKHRLRLESRCRVVGVYEAYGYFEGSVFFPSGDKFNMQIIKTDKGWELGSFGHSGNEEIWIDLVKYY